MTQAFNLSQFANKVNTSGQADLTTAVTGTLPVANGGTGAASLTGNSVAITNAGGTALSTVAAGTSGNVLTSNGTTWVSQAAAASGFTNMQVFTSPGTFTTPASTTKIKVTVVGSGGVGTGGSTPPPITPGPTTFSAGGGAGGAAIYVGAVTASTPYAITVGAGITSPSPNTSGNTSSFGSLASATGGSGSGAVSGNTIGGAGGAGTIGTILITGGSGMNFGTSVGNGQGGVGIFGGQGAFGSGSKTTSTPSGVVIVEY